MATLTANKKNKLSIAEWRGVVDGLLSQVAEWAEMEKTWKVERFPDEDRREDYGVFPVPTLDIHAPEGDITIEPIPQRDGLPIRIYMSAWPTMSRVRLLSDDRGGNWEIVTDSNVPLRQPWNSNTFFRLAKDLLDIP